MNQFSVICTSATEWEKGTRKLINKAEEFASANIATLNLDKVVTVKKWQVHITLLLPLGITKDIRSCDQKKRIVSPMCMSVWRQKWKREVKAKATLWWASFSVKPRKMQIEVERRSKPKAIALLPLYAVMNIALISIASNATFFLVRTMALPDVIHHIGVNINNNNIIKCPMLFMKWIQVDLIPCPLLFATGTANSPSLTFINRFELNHLYIQLYSCALSHNLCYFVINKNWSQ